MRYCIGCIHWRCFSHEAGHVYSEMTADSDTPAKLTCSKGHWETELSEWQDEEVTRAEIERCMELADKCPDFSERPSSSADGSR